MQRRKYYIIGRNGYLVHESERGIRNENNIMGTRDESMTRVT